MSAALIRKLRDQVTGAAVDAAWAQWVSITASAVPVTQQRVWTIIDPEALVLLSLAVRHAERRLDDLLAAWARSGASLLSIQRLVTLAKSYPESVRDQVGDFATLAVEAGHKQWARHATRRNGLAGEPRRKEIGPLRLVEGPTLMLRVRAGIGVGAKADLLTFLLGIHGAAADLRAITTATAYSDRAMRTAAEEMALARFIHEVRGTPVSYRADPRPWAEVLETYRLEPAPTPAIPPWRFWSVVFAFLVDVAAWASAAETQNWSDYMAASRARDLVDSHGRALGYAGIRLDASPPTRGAEYLKPFRDAIGRVSNWVTEHLYA